MKNFFYTLVVLVTTISVLEAQAGMIDQTFLLPGKNDLCKPHFPHPSQLLEKPVILITSDRRQALVV
jgi:hypothetical protein